MITRAESTRDAGLALISRITRWLIAGAVALSGFISIAAANAFHGHTVTARNTSTPVSSSATIGQAHSQPPPVNDQRTGLQQPAAAPAPSPAPTPAPVVSGGS